MTTRVGVGLNLKLSAACGVAARCEHGRATVVQRTVAKSGRRGQATWMQITGACDDRTTLAASKRRLRSFMPAIALPRCCTSCCTELTLKCQGQSRGFVGAFDPATVTGTLLSGLDRHIELCLPSEYS